MEQLNNLIDTAISYGRGECRIGAVLSSRDVFMQTLLPSATNLHHRWKEVQNLARVHIRPELIDGSKIALIKALRSVLGWGLKDAKEAIESPYIDLPTDLMANLLASELNKVVFDIASR